MQSVRLISYLVAGALPRMAMLVVLFVLARLLPMAEAGLFVLVTTVGELLEMSLGTWLRIYVLQREAGRPMLRPYRGGRMLVLSAALTGLAGLLAFPVAAIVTPEHFWAFALAVVAYVVAFAILRNVLTLLQTGGDHNRFVLVELARGVVMVPAVCGTAVLAPHFFLWPALALSLTTLLTALLGLAAARRRLMRPRFTSAGVVPAVRFGVPVLIDTLLSLLIINFDRFALNEILGPGSVAVYALAYALGRQPIEFIAGPLNTYALPKLFEAWANDGEAGARAVLSGLSITMFVLCAGMATGVWLLAEPLTLLLLRPEYQAPALPLVPIIGLAGCLLAFKAFIFDNVFHMLRNTRAKLPSVLAVTCASVVLVTSLVWSFGIIGAAMALLASSVLGLCASIVVSRRIFTFAMPFGSLFRIALAAAVAGLALKGLALLVAPYGMVAVILAGFVGFCIVYAAGLSVAGVSLAALFSTPWAPLRASSVR